jgi:hypothetical protein
VAAAKFGSWKDISNFLHVPLKNPVIGFAAPSRELQMFDFYVGQKKLGNFSYKKHNISSLKTLSKHTFASRS